MVLRKVLLPIALSSLVFGVFPQAIPLAHYIVGQIEIQIDRIPSEPR